MHNSYDLVLVGTGFASAFYLHEYLRWAGPRARVLVLERGERRDHAWHLANRLELRSRADAAILNRTPEKPWVFSLAFGGSSNCWWGNASRLLPSDFRLRTLYGVGADWPLGYDDLEEFYCDAEDLMAVAGPQDGSPFPRSRPYPQPPHVPSACDLLFKAHFPDSFFAQPCARPTRATVAGRPRCCASGVCSHCPVDAKFTILNEMAPLFEQDSRVELLCGANALEIEVAGDRATGVRFERAGQSERARAELVGLGANAIFNPFLLLRSGLDGPELGRGLVEQIAVTVRVDLAGLAARQGSTSITGQGTMLYDGPHRATRAAALLETLSTPSLRDERGRWLERVLLKFVFEDLRRVESRVSLASADPGRPEVHFAGPSDYGMRGVASLPDLLPQVLAPLPVEDVQIGNPRDESVAHILGTTPMGSDPARSVVDADLLHHRVRNLHVLGSSVFPSAPPAPPTLTLCALSLRAARRAHGRAT
jgi:choline dehydrogenase-like flavoprotein